jgi:hypothetical protein
LPSVSSEDKYPKLSDKDFREKVFGRYGISINSKPSLQIAYDHFGTDDPEKNGFQGRIADWYRQRHENCGIWLSLDEAEARRIAGQYRHMVDIKTNEAKLSHRGKMYFFKEDDIVRMGEEDDDRCSTAYFELKRAPNPDGKHLQCPDEVTNEGVKFGFTTNPDCTYWLTTRRFHPEYRAQVSQVTFVLPDADAAAPYLTIEFKKGQSIL